jgi:hypothetical protein
MPQLFKKSYVRVEGEGGECHVHVTLDLNITLKTDGSLDVQAKARPTVEGSQVEEVQEETNETAWVVPAFTGGKRINFGKKDE